MTIQDEINLLKEQNKKLKLKRLEDLYENWRNTYCDKIFSSNNEIVEHFYKYLQQNLFK